MKTKQNWTILVLPSSPHKSALNISVPIHAFTAVFFSLAILLFLATAGAWRMYLFQEVQEKSHRLEVENQSARSQIQDQERRIEHLTKEILSIREKAGYVQNFLGLKPQDPGAAKIGQGGVELSPRRPLSSSGSFSSESHRASKDLRALAHSLSAQDIHQLNSDLQAIVGALQARQDQLDHTPSISPIDPQGTWISSSYGLRISPFTGKEQFHPGVDIAGAEGTPIIAPAKGTVAFVGKDGALGMSVRIKHDSLFETTYGHLQKASVKKGQRVERGEVIGYMGNSGRSTGHHLHYEITKNGKNVNPLEHMMDWKNENLVMLAD